MSLSRNAFFLSMLVLFTSPFIITKLVWLSRTTTAPGVVWFTGRTIELNGAISAHLVIRFHTGKEYVSFEAPTNPALKEGDRVTVRYVKRNPADTRIDVFLRIWGDTIVYGLWPVLVLLVLYLIPESMDPVIPRKSRIIVGTKKIIQIVPATR